jgi:hypothetical protein
MLTLEDKTGGTYTYRENNYGAVLSKGKREIYVMYKSVKQLEMAQKFIADHSFNQMFNKGKKVHILGNKVSYLDFRNIKKG